MGTSKLETPFTDWLTKKLKERDWSVRYLSSVTNYSNTHIGNVINGQKPATWEFVEDMAKTFEEPVIRLFIMAGLLTPPHDVELDQESAFIIDLYQRMPREHQLELYEYIKWYGKRHTEPNGS